MSAITTILTQLRTAASLVGSAIWAIDVRDDIASALRKSADAIEECYNNVNSASLREDAFAAALQDAIDDNLLPIPGTVIENNSLSGTKIQDGTLPLSKLAEPVQITVDSALSDSSTNPVQNKVVEGAISELNGRIANELYPYDFLINYGFDTPGNIAYTSAKDVTRLGIKRDQTLVTLNTYNALFTSANATYIRLDGTILRDTARTSWTSGGINLVEGHEYAMTVKYLSGTSRRSNTQTVFIPTIAAFEAIESGANLKDSEETTTDSYTRTFIATNSPVGFLLSIPSGITFTNAKFLVTVRDVTEPINVLKDRIDIIEKNNKYDGNLYNFKTSVLGSIKYTTGEFYSASDKYASDYIPVTAGKIYFLSHGLYGDVAGIAFYDDNKTFVSGIKGNVNSSQSGKSYVFKAPDDAAYVRLSIWNTWLKILYFSESSYEVLKKWGYSIQYSGSPINFIAPSSVKIVRDYNIAMSGFSHPQDGSIANDKLFMFQSGNVTGCVFDLEDYSITSITMSTAPGHANGICFSSQYYDDSDDYPILYAATEGAKSIYVYRITENNGTYAGTYLMKINLPSIISDEQYPCMVVDKENGEIYLEAVLNGGDRYTRVIHSDGTFSYPSRRWLRYKLPEQFSSDVNLNSDPYSSENPYGCLAIIRNPSRHVNSSNVYDGSEQGRFIKDGKIYVVSGFSASGVLNVINCKTGELDAHIILTGYLSQEPEVLDYYEGRIILVDASGTLYNIFTD